MNGLAAAAPDGAAFNRTYLYAATRSNRLWAAGLQNLGQRCSGTVQDMTEGFQVTARAVSSAMSVWETLNIQAAHLSTKFEQPVKQATVSKRCNPATAR